MYPQPSGPIDISFRTAIKIGAGLTVGVGLVFLVIQCVLIILMALGMATGIGQPVVTYGN